MTKRKVSRLIAAFLTMAMAFSVLAMPASAAAWAIEVDNVQLEEGGPTVTVLISNQSVPLLIDTIKAQAGDEVDQISGLLDVVGKIASGNLGKLVFSMSSSLLDKVNEQMDGTSLKIYDGDVPKNAYIGIIGTGSSTPNWYKEDAAKKVINAVTSGDENSEVSVTADGILMVGGNAIQPMSPDELKYVNKPLVYAGIAVAVAGAATGIYFYTHPAAWKKVTTTVKKTWNKITGKPTEEETETAEEGEETPAEGEAEGATGESAGTPAETAAAGTEIPANATPAQEAPAEDGAVVVPLSAA
jgi:hypothetical protein